MRKTCLVCLMICFCIVIYAVIRDCSSLLTFGVSMIGCLTGTYIGLTVKERSRHGKSIDGIKSWLVSLLLAGVFCEVVVILANIPPLGRYHWIDLPNYVISILAVSAIMVIAAVFVIRRMNK